MKTIIKKISELFKKKTENVTAPDFLTKEEEEEREWRSKTDAVMLELYKKAKNNDYDAVFKMLEDGADPNLPIYVVVGYSYDNGLITGSENVTRHILDLVSDEAMIKLLRAYGSKTPREISKENWEKKRREAELKEQEHKIRSNAQVNSLLQKRQLPVYG